MVLSVAGLILLIAVIAAGLAMLPRLLRRISAFESSLVIEHQRKVDEDRYLRGGVSDPEHLQTQIDALQLEVERLTERLDFTEKLLEERPAPASLPAPPEESA